MSDLRSARTRLGLTQARVAELFGTSAANISAYEHRRLLPGPTVMARIEALARVPASSPYAAQPLMTAASTSASIRRAVRADDHAGALRLLAQSLADLRRVAHEPGGRGLYLVAPGGTGSKEWNALLAGAVARECRLVGIDPPRWTRVQPLPHGWSPITVPGLRDYLVERTPPELARLGVWLDEGSLGDVDDMVVFVDALFAHGVDERFPRATAPDDTCGRQVRASGRPCLLGGGHAGRCRSRLPQV